MDAFNLLYSKLLLAKLCLFDLMPFLLKCFGNLVAYVAAYFVTSVCRWLGGRVGFLENQSL